MTVILFRTLTISHTTKEEDRTHTVIHYYVRHSQNKQRSAVKHGAIGRGMRSAVSAVAVFSAVRLHFKSSSVTPQGLTASLLAIKNVYTLD